MQNPAIGLMSPTESHIEVLDEESQIYATGNWPISIKKIEELKQKDLIVVKGSKKPAYIGGKIIDYKFIRKSTDKLGRERSFYSLIFKRKKEYDGYEDHYDKWNSRSTVRYF